jgi:hypothetical protein
VVAHNTNGGYGEAREDGYFNKLSKAFKLFRGEVNTPICPLADLRTIFPHGIIPDFIIFSFYYKMRLK